MTRQEFDTVCAEFGMVPDPPARYRKGDAVAEYRRNGAATASGHVDVDAWSLYFAPAPMRCAGALRNVLRVLVGVMP